MFTIPSKKGFFFLVESLATESLIFNTSEELSFIESPSLISCEKTKVVPNARKINEKTI